MARNWRKSGRAPGSIAAMRSRTSTVRGRRVPSEQDRKFEQERLRQLFQQAPGFICVLRGPSHIYELANDAYYQLVGPSSVIRYLRCCRKSFHKAFWRSSIGFIRLASRLSGAPCQSNCREWPMESWNSDSSILSTNPSSMRVAMLPAFSCKGMMSQKLTSLLKRCPIRRHMTR